MISRKMRRDMKLGTKLAWQQKASRKINRVEYSAVFSPVTRFETLRFLLAFAADYEIEQVDIKTAFLNGDLNKKKYMEPPIT